MWLLAELYWKKKLPFKETDGIGKLQIILFEETVEHQLFQPTFITGYPTEISPLARRSDQDPELTDRFEFLLLVVKLRMAFRN